MGICRGEGILALCCLALFVSGTWAVSWIPSKADHGDVRCRRCKLDDLKNVDIEGPEDGQCLIFHESDDEDALSAERSKRRGEWRNEDCPGANCSCILNVATVEGASASADAGQDLPLLDLGAACVEGSRTGCLCSNTNPDEIYLASVSEAAPCGGGLDCCCRFRLLAGGTAVQNPTTIQALALCATLI